MIKIIQILFDTYGYIESVICPESLSNEDNNNKDNTYKQAFQSTINNFQQCKWCGTYFDTTNQVLYLYMDNIYCTIKCRSSQIKKDIK